MIKNIGFADRLIRIMFGLFVLMLTILGELTGTWAWILNIAGLILLGTAVIGTCPIWLALGISTNRKSSSADETHE